MCMPLVSIIIPVYNVDKYLSRCVESVLNQTYMNFELLLINDGSTDSSGAICDYYAAKDSRIIVCHEKNEGVSITRNKGIKKSIGKYLTFIDSDDWVENDYIESFFLDKESENVDLIIQGLFSDYGGGKIITHFSYENSFVNLENESQKIIKYNLFHDGCPVAKLFKKDIVENNNLYFDSRLNLHEDHIFILNYYLYCSKILLSSNIGYHYMRDQTFSSLTNKIQPYEKLFLASDLFFQVYKKLFELFQIKNEEYIADLLTHYGLGQRLRAVFNIYKQNVDYKRRKEIILKEKIKYKTLFVRYYKTKTFFRFLFYYIYIYTPFYFFDFLLKILYFKKDEKFYT